MHTNTQPIRKAQERITYIFDADTPAYRIVTPGAVAGVNPSVKLATGATVPLIGVVDPDQSAKVAVAVEAGKEGDVIYNGIAAVELGGTVAFGDQVTSDANGKGVVAADTNTSVGMAMQAGVSGDLIGVMLRQGTVSL